MHNAEQTLTPPPENQATEIDPDRLHDHRITLDEQLIHESSPARYVAGVEDRRLAAVLRETDAGSGRQRTVGDRVWRSPLVRGILRSRTPERPDFAERQQDYKETIKGNLEASRRLIRRNTLWGVDDALVDTRLNVRDDTSIVPPWLRMQHRQAELQFQDGDPDKQLTFLRWMTDYASDEQLLQVWQWHDSYLRARTEDPELQKQVERVKAGFLRGLDAAIQAGVLDPAMAVDPQDIMGITVQPGSPLSPMMAGVHAFVPQRNPGGRVQVGTGELADYRLYHEFMHIVKRGLLPALNEAATDILAAEIYRHANPQAEPVNPEDDSYGDEVATVEILKQMSDGRLDTLRMSRHYAGPDEAQNTLDLLYELDGSGTIASIFAAAVMRAQDVAKKARTDYDRTSITLYTQRQIKEDLELIAPGMSGAAVHDVMELAANVLTQDFLETRSHKDIDRVLDIMARANSVHVGLTTGNS